MNAQTLILSLTTIEATSTDKVENAENVLNALYRMKRVPGMNTFMVRSAIRKQKKFVESLKKV